MEMSETVMLSWQIKYNWQRESKSYFNRAKIQSRYKRDLQDVKSVYET